MVDEHKLKNIGCSKFFLIPNEYIKIYKLDEYIYMCEVSSDGKTITFKRMRKDKDFKKIK